MRLTSGFRAAGYAVVGTALRCLTPRSPTSSLWRATHRSRDSAARGDRALERFGRIDSLINNAGSLHRQAVHRLHPGGLCRDHSREPGWVLSHHPTRHRQMVTQEAVTSSTSQPVSSISPTAPDRPRSRRSPRPDSPPWPAARHRICVTWRAMQRGRLGLSRRRCTTRVLRGHGGPRWSNRQISDVINAILYLERATFVTGETLHIDGGQAAGH